MKISKTTLISLILLLAIVLLATIVYRSGVYESYFTKKTLSLETPIPTIEAVNLYKKYTNKKVGYEITIPKDMAYEEKMDGQFVTLGNKIIIYVLTSDPEKCSEECPVVDSGETVNVNGVDARFFKLHWKYDGINTPQNFVNYVFALKDKYLVFQLQEVDFNQDVDINHKIVDLDPAEFEQFNKIVNSLVINQ